MRKLLCIFGFHSYTSRFEQGERTNMEKIKGGDTYKILMAWYDISASRCKHCDIELESSRQLYNNIQNEEIRN
jgi:hypothetical protein